MKKKGNKQQRSEGTVKSEIMVSLDAYTAREAKR